MSPGGPWRSLELGYPLYNLDGFKLYPGPLNSLKLRWGLWGYLGHAGFDPER